jgi:AraC-like DNA-binding protein
MLISRFKKWSTLILCVFIYCFTTTVCSQNNDTSSSQLDRVAFEKSLEGKSYEAVTNVFYENYVSDSIKSAITIKYIENHFLNSDNKKHVVDSYFVIGLWNDKLGNIDKAVAANDKGIVIAKELEDTNLLYIGYLRKGSVLYYVGRNKEALNAFLKALNYAKAQNNISRQLSITNSICLIKIQANDHFGAIDLYQENLKAIQQYKDESLQPKELEVYLGLCKAYINIEEYEKATEYCNKGIVLSEQLNALNFKSYLICGLGEIAANTEKFDQAHRYFNESNEIIKKIGGDKAFDPFMKLYLGKTYFLEGKFEEAVAELLKGEALIEEYKVSFLSIQELYYYLATSYVELGNIEQGVKYLDKNQKISNENDKRRQEINSNLVNDFDFAELKRKIETIKEQSRRTKYLYYSGIGLLLFVIIGLILFNRKQQQKNKERFNALMHQLEEKRQQEKLHQDKVASHYLKETTSKETKAIEENLVQTKTKTRLTEIDSKDLEILKKLIEFEEKELFLSNESTLVEVAKKIQTNTTYLSKVINTHKEKSFTAYITDLRVDYAIERLSHDRKFRSFTIGAIAQEIGFKRSESFSKAFKVKTGLYPSYFVKQVEKQ